jgi:hypothetical protein
MALEIKTSIIIQAEPAEVWTTFSAFETYPKWNPFLSLVEGNIKEGERIRIIAGGTGFKPKVLVFEPGKQFEWIGRLVMPGLFDGQHKFELLDNGDGTTTFIHNEKFTGVLIPLFKKILLEKTSKGFEAMNQALKERVEAKVPDPN